MLIRVLSRYLSLSDEELDTNLDSSEAGALLQVCNLKLDI